MVVCHVDDVIADFLALGAFRYDSCTTPILIFFTCQFVCLHIGPGKLELGSPSVDFNFQVGLEKLWVVDLAADMFMC